MATTMRGKTNANQIPFLLSVANPTEVPGLFQDVKVSTTILREALELWAPSLRFIGQLKNFKPEK